jgi:hypothetical protein
MSVPFTSAVIASALVKTSTFTGAVAPVAGEQEGGDTGIVRLKGQVEHVHLEPDILGEAVGDAIGGLNTGRHPGGGRALGALNTLLDVADAGEILIELLLVAGGELTGAPVEASGYGQITGDTAAFGADIVEDGALLALA